MVYEIIVVYRSFKQILVRVHLEWKRWGSLAFITFNLYTFDHVLHDSCSRVIDNHQLVSFTQTLYNIQYAYICSCEPNNIHGKRYLSEQRCSYVHLMSKKSRKMYVNNRTHYMIKLHIASLLHA